MSHVALSAAVHRNAACQPHFVATIGTSIGATIAPIFEPELKMPAASARSRRGNHSATALIAAGKLPASPRPSAKRAAAKLATPAASAWLIAATLHTLIATA